MDVAACSISCGAAGTILLRVRGLDLAVRRLLEGKMRSCFRNGCPKTSLSTR